MPNRITTDTGCRRMGWTIAALALLTGVLGIFAVLAPVIADDPVVSWPRTGQQPTSTVLPLAPYRPLQLTATMPCATLQTLNARPGGGEALRTLPAEVGTAPGEGLVVAAAQGIVTVTASGAELTRETLPAGSCSYQVLADAGGIRVARDGTDISTRADLLPPQVAELQTDAVGQTSGLSVTLHTDARYQSRPAPLKTALLIAHGLALTVLLVLAWRRWRGEGPGLVRPRPSWADAVVVGISLIWVVLAPVNIDDSWYLLMARNAMESGYIGNVIYQFNVSENPFSASQYAMQAWGAFGDNWSLAWMRLLPLGYGLVSYVLLRVLIETVLDRAARRPLVPWTVAAGHLLWWLPYGITLRPEPLIVLGTSLVLMLAELARRRRSVGVLAAATAVAAFTVTASPTGLVAVAPLVLCLPWLWQWWRASDLAGRIATVLLAGAAASIVVPIGFADASLGDVLESIAVHRWYYRQHAWYDEYLHYANLLVPDERGAWGKRLPVLLTLGVLLAVAIRTGAIGARRGGDGDRSGRLLGEMAAITGFVLVAMALTPTKWVNHFGAIAAPATVLIAAAVIRSPLPQRVGAAAVAIGTAGLVVAASVGFAGPNLWRPLSDWGQPFGDHTLIATPYVQSLLTPSLGPLSLRNPLLWLAIAGLGYWLTRSSKRWPGPDRAVLITANGLAVLLMLTVFTVAPLRQYPGTSVALMNLRALTGQPCGLATSVTVFTDVKPGLGPATGAATLTGDMRQAPLPEPVPMTPPGVLWHSDVPGGTGTGTVQTPWYALPGPVPDGRVVVPVLGTLTNDQRLAVQVVAGDPDRVRTVPVDSVGHKVRDKVGGKTGWAEVTVALADAGLDAPSAVRVIAQDRVAGPDSWFAVAQPRLTGPRPVTSIIAGRPVFADQVSAGLWPCQDQIAVRHGMVQAPRMRLRIADGLEDATIHNAVFADNGGTLLQVNRTATFVELPSQLMPPGVPTLGWGHVEEVVYTHPVGLVDLRVDQQRRAGWIRLPTLIGQPYTGRAYTG
ncbi:MAG TPA: arabinosyltransferase domain-containing protein [Pseudonocardiaceae bacterium]|nr:arabinosyltransferase domain-containing protein [Pseudonocardiaceae bacterium]